MNRFQLINTLRKSFELASPQALLLTKNRKSVVSKSIEKKRRDLFLVCSVGFLVLGVICFCLFAFPPRAHAAPGLCEISLKVVAADSRSGKAGPARIPSSLHDMASSLRSLSHLDFRFLSEHYAQASVGSSAKLKILDSMGQMQHVEVAPSQGSGSNTETMVVWNDKDGTNLLSTKVMLAKGKRMVLGTNSSEELSTVLGLKIKCGNQ